MGMPDIFANDPFFNDPFLSGPFGGLLGSRGGPSGGGLFEGGFFGHPALRGPFGRDGSSNNNGFINGPFGGGFGLLDQHMRQQQEQLAGMHSRGHGQPHSGGLVIEEVHEDEEGGGEERDREGGSGGKGGGSGGGRRGVSGSFTPRGGRMGGRGGQEWSGQKASRNDPLVEHPEDEEEEEEEEKASGSVKKRSANEKRERKGWEGEGGRGEAGGDRGVNRQILTNNQHPIFGSMMPFGGSDNSSSFFFSSSSVTYSGHGGNSYYSSSTQRVAGNGVAEERHTEEDSTGFQKMRLSRAIGEKGRTVSIAQRGKEVIENVETLHNLSQEEAPTFDQTWQRHAKGELGGGRGAGRNPRGLEPLGLPGPNSPPQRRRLEQQDKKEKGSGWGWA